MDWEYKINNMTLNEVEANIKYAKQGRENAVMAHDMVHYDWLLRKLNSKKRELIK